MKIVIDCSAIKSIHLQSVMLASNVESIDWDKNQFAQTDTHTRASTQYSLGSERVAKEEKQPQS